MSSIAELEVEIRSLRAEVAEACEERDRLEQQVEQLRPGDKHELSKLSTPGVVLPPAEGEAMAGVHGCEADDAMNRYAAGDVDAFATLYDLLAPRLYAFLNRQLRDRALAQDLFQQTFLQLHDKRGTFIAGASVTAWAFSIARNLVIDGSRKASREGGEPPDDGGAAIGPSDTLTADQIVEAKQTASRLAAVIAAIPASQREAFTLVKNEGLTLAEAAEVLGVTLSAVKLRLFRATEALHAVVDGDPN